MKNGGYIIVSVADTNIYEKVNSALTLGKPILFYEDARTCYYIDTISKDGDGNIILTKGGKTFTITDVNSVMATGEVQNHLYALSFNVSDTYYTIFTKISCGMNNKVINTNSDDYTEVTLTSEEQQLLQNAMNSALCKNGKLVIMNIGSDSDEVYRNNNSTTDYIDCENENNDGYSLGLRFTDNVLTIINNPNDDDIIIYEIQLF